MPEALPDELQLERDGAQLFAGHALPKLKRIDQAISDLPLGEAGIRIVENAGLADLLSAHSPIGRIAASFLGSKAKPVRAILFDKTEAANWGLGWHQDRTIAVRERVDESGFGSWSVKQGIQHVAPPYEILERMVTLRIHIDAVDDNNGPLEILGGSHRFGRVPKPDIPALEVKLPCVVCKADAGDVWAYSLPIIHRSRPSLSSRSRRVLHIDYSADALPGALEWRGL